MRKIGLANVERDLRCTECGDLVRVAELPKRFLDPATYVCGECLAGGKAA